MRLEAEQAGLVRAKPGDVIGQREAFRMRGCSKAGQDPLPMRSSPSSKISSKWQNLPSTQTV